MLLDLANHPATYFIAVGVGFSYLLLQAREIARIFREHREERRKNRELAELAEKNRPEWAQPFTQTVSLEPVAQNDAVKIIPGNSGPKLPGNVKEAMAGYALKRLREEGRPLPALEILTEFAKIHGPENLNRGILKFPYPIIVDGEIVMVHRP